MSDGEQLLGEAHAAWLEAKRKAEAAQELARLAEEEACLRFADYAELAQPSFAAFFRRVLNTSKQHQSNGE